jgi:hypothetical protein
MGLVSKRPPKRPMRQSNTSTLLKRLGARRLAGITILEFRGLGEEAVDGERNLEDLRALRPRLVDR